ncbi:hypothetical protein GWK47_010217 [Chionoecetes opilio]|uniref:Uncharacterized protein n=1 Tax=Chionoecetes opilio TaxID=41210 RepID=A0A8J4Y4Q2_CHIOP|nr:hypothetical protein GWK47_010217 [Chionoecetes opilio]
MSAQRFKLTLREVRGDEHAAGRQVWSVQYLNDRMRRLYWSSQGQGGAHVTPRGKVSDWAGRNSTRLERCSVPERRSQDGLSPRSWAHTSGLPRRQPAIMTQQADYSHRLINTTAATRASFPAPLPGQAMPVGQSIKQPSPLVPRGSSTLICIPRSCGIGKVKRDLTGMQWSEGR